MDQIMALNKPDPIAPAPAKPGGRRKPRHDPGLPSMDEIKAADAGDGGRLDTAMEEEMHDLKVKMRKCDRLSKLRKRGRNLSKEQQALLLSKEKMKRRLDELKKLTKEKRR